MIVDPMTIEGLREYVPQEREPADEKEEEDRKTELSSAEKREETKVEMLLRGEMEKLN